MATVTLLSMRERVVRAADAEGTIDPTNAADKAYLDPIINSALGRLHEAMTLAFEDYHLTVSAAFAVTASPVSLLTGPSPGIADLLKLRSLERLRTDGKYDDVPRISLADRNRAVELGFFLAGADSLYLYPAERLAGTYRLWYTPAFALLTADSGAGGTYETVNGWEDMAICDAAMQVKDGLEKDYSLLAQQFSKREAQLEAIRGIRNSSGPKKVRHVRWTLRDSLTRHRWDDLP